MNTLNGFCDLGSAGQESVNQFEKLETEVRSEALRGKRVLLVEDNALNREIIGEILEDLGVYVLTAVNGKEGVDAVEKAGPNGFDFILMDIMMPGIDGYEATRKIRTLEAETDNHIPIIALTANA